jgi:Domain of unknown function (DUF4282)
VAFCQYCGNELAPDAGVCSRCGRSAPGAPQTVHAQSHPVSPGGLDWAEFITFRRMVTPVIIQILFWVGVGLSVLFALGTIVSGAKSPFGGSLQILAGLVMLVAGPLIVRVYCEILIVAFRINDTLSDIRTALNR